MRFCSALTGSLSFLFALTSGSSAIAEPAKVVAIVRELQELPETQDVKLFRANNPKGVVLKLRESLAPGDLFKSVSHDVVVQIRCEDGTVMTFRKKFQVLVTKAKRASCAVNVLDGALGVIADKPTEADAAGLPLTSKGTIYSVDVHRPPVETEAPGVQVAVFEGSVELGKDSRREIPQGKVLTLSKGDVSAAQLRQVTMEADVQPAARAFAQVDAARARKSPNGSQNLEVTFRRLSELHARVLASPGDREAHLALARLQLSYGLVNSARFHLRRSGLGGQDIRNMLEQSTPEDAEDKLPAEQSGAGFAPALYPALLVSGGPEPLLVDIEARVADGTITSEHYCYFAIGVRDLAKNSTPGPNESMRPAVIEYAEKALDLHKKDNRLKPEQYDQCTRFAAGNLGF